MRKKPSQVMAMARPEAMPLPAQRTISAFTKPDVHEKWSADAAGIRALSMGDNVITMFDLIGEDYWTGGGVTAKKVASQLRAIGDNPVEVQINSPGGDMFEGIAIYNILREHPQPVTIKVMGMAASAASVIAMAGDDVQIGASSFLMIHNYLEPFDQAMVSLYAQRSGKADDEIAAWMNKETYFSGTQAVEKGFADNLLAADEFKLDGKAQASDRSANALRVMELKLVAAGDTRSQARSSIKEIKGTPGAAQEATPGAGETEWLPSAAALLESLRA